MMCLDMFESIRGEENSTEGGFLEINNLLNVFSTGRQVQIPNILIARSVPSFCSDRLSIP